MLFVRHETGQPVQKTSGIKAEHAGWKPTGNFKALVGRMRRKAVDAAAEYFQVAACLQAADLLEAQTRCGRVG